MVKSFIKLCIMSFLIVILINKCELDDTSIIVGLILGILVQLEEQLITLKYKEEEEKGE